MESFYFSVILLLLGVIAGGVFALGLLQNVQRPYASNRYAAAYYPRTVPVESSLGREGWGGLILLLVLILILGTAKNNIESWWKSGQESTTKSQVQKVAPQRGAVQSIESSLMRSVVPPPAARKADQPTSGWYIQVGVYSSPDAATTVLKSWQKDTDLPGRVIPFYQIPATFKVWLGPFLEKKAARRHLARLGTGFVVEFEE